MTDKSFMEGRGLAPVKTPHLGPASAAKLVSAYGCYVHPLALGSKVPATKAGVLDAVADASAITGNYGVAMGASNLVAIDLDDYVEGNQCEQFVADLELPPTFTVLTGSGGRSLWYRAPVSADVPPGQNVLGYSGVDLRGSNSYALGPGNKLHPDNIKPGAPGDGNYTFDKASPREFTQLPLSLLTALAKERAAKDAKREANQKHSGSSAAFEALSDHVKSRVISYMNDTITSIKAELDEIADWPTGQKDVKGRGWDLIINDTNASLASLVKAEWNDLGEDDAESLLEQHLPNGWGYHSSMGMNNFRNAMEKDAIGPRPAPFDLSGIDYLAETWDDSPYTPTRPFGEAGDAPGAEPALTVWPQYEQNDYGNSQRIAAWAKGNLFWLHDAKVWVRYNGVHWEKSDGAGDNAAVQALNVAYQLEMDHYPDTAAEGETSPQKKFFNWVVSQKMAGKYSAAARTAQMSEALNRSEHDFDADPYLLGVQNGTVDLRTGELRPGTKDELIATVTPSRYDPTATAPRFMQYLEESLPDPEVRAYLQRAMGYSITGTTIEQIMFIHHGKTSNGKSVLMNVLAAVVGQYSGGADPKALIESKNEQHSTHVASLAGPRLLMMSETARGARLSDTLIKQITGGDWVTARKLYKENQDYRILGKIHMATNHLPHIVSSPSTNRRIHLIHWPVEVAEEKIDLRLASKIIHSELEGVLNWLVQGAIEWHHTLEESQSGPIRKGGRPSGLAAPAQILIDTAKYLRSEDNIQEWMDERTEPSDDVISAKDLYWDYRSWAEARGDRPMTQRAMCIDLESHDIEKKRTAAYNGYRIALKPLQAVRNFFDEA